MTKMRYKITRSTLNTLLSVAVLFFVLVIGAESEAQLHSSNQDSITHFTETINCSPGQLCRAGLAPIPCPEDHYCTGSSSDPQPCDQSCICPCGSSVVCPERCPNGRLCNGKHGMGYCPIGRWCANNVATLCSVDTWGDQYGLETESCSGSCSLFWTSSTPGSKSCSSLSKASIGIISVSLCVGLGILMALVSCIGSKVMQLQGTAEPMSQDDVLLEAECRKLTQQKILEGVDALATRVANQTFPSLFTTSSSLTSSNSTATADQAQSRFAAAARADLINHLKAQLLQHPRLHFDDETYPWGLPLWAEVDPTSEDGELSLVSASSVIAASIRTAIETDVQQWLALASQKEVQQAAHEEAKQSQRASSSSTPPSSSPMSSRWTNVDNELQAALGIAVPNPSSSCGSCVSRLRMAYSSSSFDLQTITWNFIIMSLDILVLVACFLSIFGASLVTVEVPFDALNSQALSTEYNIQRQKPYIFRINWNEVEFPVVNGYRCDGPDRKHVSFVTTFSFNKGYATDTGNMLFQTELNACTVRVTLMIVTCVCFVLVSFFSVTRFASKILQLTRLGRGTCVALQRTATQAIHMVRKTIPELMDNYVADWYLQGGPLAFTRFLGMMCLVVAVTVYSFGCIAPLTHAPAVAQEDFKANMGWDVTLMAVRNLVPMMRVEYSVNMQATFIVTIVATALAILPALYALQHSFRKVQTFTAVKDENNHLDRQLEQVLSDGTVRDLGSDLQTSLLDGSRIHGNAETSRIGAT